VKSTGKQVVDGSPPPRGNSEREEQLLEALEEIFLQEGFRRVAVGELAARLHCSRATLYALAPSKERLFLLVLERLLARIRDMGRAAYDEGAAPEDCIVRAIAPGVTELRKSSVSFFADIAGFAPARRMLADHQRARVDEACRTIEEGIRKGALRGVHSRLVAEGMLAAVQRIMDPEFLSEAGLRMSEAVEEIEDLFLHGFLHPRRRRVARPRKQSRGS
jgi:AcrR family transcriptional regulator